MEENKVIQVKNVTKKYHLYEKPQDRFKETISIRKKSYHKDFYALKDIAFDVLGGETVGIVGTNGSGKSTLLKMITGVLKPTQGDIFVQGRISALLELGAGFNQEYSGIENIYLNGKMMGYSRKEMQEKVDSIIEFAEIGDFIYQPVKTYSSGMFARLAFAVSINVEPDILIVDEALSVGDLFFQNKCFKKFEELKNKNVTILFVSHDISSVRQMCSRVLWIEKGEQILFDRSDKVCDLYMDMKRKGMNEIVEPDLNANIENIIPINNNNQRIYPRLCVEKSDLKSDKFQIAACFFTDIKKNHVTHLSVDDTYKLHVVIQFMVDMKDLIVGFVLENNKGLPLFDINNFINQRQGICGKSGSIIEVIYEFKLPRLMKGNYILSVAVAQGTQENHEMHTWLHGVGEIEIINMGFNSSYIEIPAKINVEKVEKENIIFLD